MMYAEGGGALPGSDVAMDVTFGLKMDHGRGQLMDELEKEEFGYSGALGQQVAPQLRGREFCMLTVT